MRWLLEFWPTLQMYPPENSKYRGCDSLWFQHHICSADMSFHRKKPHRSRVRHFVARQYATFPGKQIAMIIAPQFYLQGEEQCSSSV